MELDFHSVLRHFWQSVVSAWVSAKTFCLLINSLPRLFFYPAPLHDFDSIRSNDPIKTKIKIKAKPQ